MKIFIDESGSFVNAPKIGSWNVVSAFVMSDDSLNGIERVLFKLKAEIGVEPNCELKLKDVPEDLYCRFLEDVNIKGAIMFTVATDSGRNSRRVVIEHRKTQVGKILEHIGKMRSSEGRDSLELLASQVSKLSPQLYLQMRCQIELMIDVVSTAITYFAQISPKTLSSFCWKVDQKNSNRTEFENAFEKISPMLLQTQSIKKPMMMAREFDYSAMADYMYSVGETPEYLEKVYGIKTTGGVNIQKIIREDIEFVDSKKYAGIQVIDLLASGMRRCLRLDYKDTPKIAALLGPLMIRTQRNIFPIELVTLDKSDKCPEHIAALIKTMAYHSKTLIRD